MTLYAEGTSVPVERSRTEIERTLTRYGADAFGYTSERGRAVIAFRVKGRAVKMTLLLPDDEPFRRTSQGRARSEDAARREWEAACRQRWRALCLVVKAKLEAVASGITTFDTEWMPYMVLPSGRTVAEEVLPELAAAAEEGRAPRLLLGMDRP